MKTTTPITLNIRCAKATLLAPRLPPIEASSAVTHVPIFAPIIRPIAPVRFIRPAPIRAITRPDVADEDWIIPVKIAPARMPRKRFPETLARKDFTDSTSFMKRTDCDRKLMPRKRIPKPNKTSPKSLSAFFVPNSLNTTPRKIAGIMIHSILNATSCAVTVVPILAPKITPRAWESDINPAFTKPTSITVVAEDDWIIPVMIAPTRTP